MEKGKKMLNLKDFSDRFNCAMSALAFSALSVAAAVIPSFA